MKFKGLITYEQKNIDLPPQHWKFGIIDNDKYIIDPLLHWGCFLLGYTDDYGIIDYVSDILKSNKPEIAENIQYDDNYYLNHISFKLADKLYDITNGYKSFYALSGSDANEGAIKLASAYHKSKGNNRKKIVSLINSYHGSTMLTSSIGSDNLLNDPFYTLNPYQDILRIQRDFDIKDIEWDNVVCFVAETCSHGNGMIPFSNEFWEKLQYIQKEHDVLIVIDDVFFGGGKTGTYIGWKNLPITPDIFTMGKSITGGYFPLSITLYNEKVDKSLPNNFSWDHGYTYSFSLSGIASAYRYLEILEEHKLLNNYDILVKEATSIFSKYAKILSSFGLTFLIETKQGPKAYIIPLTANDKYFEILRNDLCG